MSIVIAVLHSAKKELYIGGDRRITLANEKYEDTFQKVNRIRKDLYLGCTGDANLAESLHKYIIENLKTERVDVIVYGLMDFDLPNLNNRNFQVILCGKDDVGELFLFAKKFNEKGKLHYDDKLSITGNSTERAISIFENYIYVEKLDFIQSIHKTIEDVSEFDVTVSKESNIFSSNNWKQLL